MDIKIKAVRFEASEKLEDFVVKKISKLERFSGDIGNVEVSMKVVKPETAMNKEVTIKVAMPGKASSLMRCIISSVISSCGTSTSTLSLVCEKGP